MSEKITSMLAPSFLPATAVLEMTYRCNHKCLFCSVPWEMKGNGFVKRKELTTAEWKDTIAKLTEMGVLSFAFTGGEPLMKENIREIIEFATKQTATHIETEGDSLKVTKAPPSIYLISNGTLVNEEIIAFCKDLGVNLSMSLPGLTTYKYHTKAGDPNHILEMFELTAKAGINTTVNSAVTKVNLFELYETLSSALIAGASSVLINRFLPGGRGFYNQKELLLSIDDINQMLEVTEEVLKTADRRGHVGTELPKCIVRKSDYEHLKIGSQCSAGRDFFTVGPSGYIRTCNHSPIELNSIREIDSMKDDAYWKRFVFRDYRPAMCDQCDIRFGCDGGCREASHIMFGELNSDDYVFLEKKPAMPVK